MPIELPDINVRLAMTDQAHQHHATVAGPRQITDVYLLGLCQQNGGTLVPLDRGITDSAIVSPHAELIRRL